MKPDGVAGVVLAAGRSTRMGANKLLLRLGAETVLRRAVRTAVEAGLDPLLVVLGHDLEQNRAELGGLPCTWVPNPWFAQGSYTSLRAGFRSVPDSSAAAIVILADMPLVTSSMLRRLVDQHRRLSARLVVTDYEGVEAPPVLYDRSLYTELRAIEDPLGGKSLLSRHAVEAVRVGAPRRALADLDVPADVASVEAILASLDVSGETGRASGDIPGGGDG